jgi:hypothetical protein
MNKIELNYDELMKIIAKFYSIENGKYHTKLKIIGKGKK